MVKCPACLSGEIIEFVSAPVDREYYVIREVNASIKSCHHCKALFQEPMPSSEDCGTFYPADYQNYTSGRVPFLTSMLERQQQSAASAFLGKVGKDSHILDYGCGDGMFLSLLSLQGATHIYGYEPSYRENSQLAEKNYFITNDLEEMIERNLQFGVIRLNHVIEHLPDIDEKMNLLRALLKPDGVIIGQTPNPDHVTARIFKGLWGGLHYPYHTILFSPSALSHAAGRWGLRVSDQQGTIMPTGWAMSVENLLKTIFRSQRRGRLPVYAFLVLAGVAVSLIDKMICGKNTAVFDFELRKLSK